MSKNEKTPTEQKVQDAPVQDVGAQAVPPTNEQVQLDPKDAKIAELTSLLQHKQAEFENYQKRIEKASKEHIQFASERLIQKFVPIYDNFALSLKHKENVKEFVSGVHMIEGELKRLLESEGLAIQSLKDKPFDPKLATAIATMVNEKVSEGTVLDEVSPCYLLHGKVIKHARVIVSKREEAK